MTISDNALCDAMHEACDYATEPELRFNVVKVTAPSWAEKRQKAATATQELIQNASGKVFVLADVITKPINTVWTNVSDGRFKLFLGDLETTFELPEFTLNRTLLKSSVSFSFLIGHVVDRL